MGDLTGEDWFVSHWRSRRSADPSLAEQEAEQVWHFARCDLDDLELTSLVDRLYYGPTGTVEGFFQASESATVQFNMELYGEHHAALFSLHDGRLDVLNQLPEREPLDSFVRQLNESLDRHGRRLVELSQLGGALRLVKSSPADAPPAAPPRRGVIVVALALGVAAAIAAALLAVMSRSTGDDGVATTTIAGGPVEASLAADASVDCRAGTNRIDRSIEVREVTVTEDGDATTVLVALQGAPFGRYSTSVHLIVPETPPAAVGSPDALAMLFLTGRRWYHELHDGISTSKALVIAPGGLVAGPPPLVILATDADGRQTARFEIQELRVTTPATMIVATFGAANDNGGAGPDACTASTVTLTRPAG